jgi:hypothetical protein
METQVLLFNQIKHSLPNHLSLVDEVSELLKISYDSAYRRIRGEKALSLGELKLISNHFKISIDTLFSLKSENVIFRDFQIGPDGISIKDWLKVILQDMNRIHAAKEKVIMYSAKDPPLFHYFQIPEIGHFKTFFWQKTLLQFPEFEDKKFSLKSVDEEIDHLGKLCLAKYVRIPTIELWNVDTFLIAFSQMEYYWVSDLFENKDDLYILCDKVELWLRHIQKQAELGFKYLYDTEPEGVEDNFKLYINEVVLNDNSIYVKMDDVCVTYITDNVLSLLITTDPSFCRQKEKFLRGLCQKSSLISHVNAKDRHRFFNRFYKRIEHFKNTLG